jgi:hypothetical protein
VTLPVLDETRIRQAVDIADTDPGWLGPFNFFSLLLLTVVTGWVLGGAARLAHR